MPSQHSENWPNVDRVPNRPAALGWLTPSIVEQFRAGDERVFAAVVGCFAPVLRKEVQRVIAAADDVDDVMQETWIRVYERRAQFGDHGSLEGWLRCICRRRCVDWLRARSRCVTEALRDDVIADPRSAIACSADAAEREGLRVQNVCDWVDDRIMLLPGLQRNVAALRWLLGWRTKRIALHLQVAPGTVKAELFRARDKLRRKISDEFRES